ncbi:MULTISPECIES: hypothetical protein [unclassified Niallia]|nr:MULTISPECIES: hypothetical protein [unclassified Niallia]MCM3033105.1 hypothetical protein [Niallia sp. MER 6]UPO90659.1 hypothetical protein L8T27_021670 [Niallia sp. Man26]
MILERKHYMHEIIPLFLNTEISEQEYYDGIIYFIYSSNIRSGEYECNQFVVKKMDHLNYIIFEEYVINNKREIHHSVSISKSELVKVINTFAENQGFVVRSYDRT